MEKKRTNQKTRTVGNGEGSLYYSEALQCWIYQYFDKLGKRKSMKQKKNELVKDFKARVTTLKEQLNNGTYIGNSNKTVKSIIEEHIKQKFNDGLTCPNSYRRDKATLRQLERCCPNLVNTSIQKVTFQQIQVEKEAMKQYAQSNIEKMWRLLFKCFRIAASPSVRLIPYNLIDDENLKVPLSTKKTNKKVALSNKEIEKLESILDNEERNHKYRNIVKLQFLTAMRIGEVLARKKSDINKDNRTLSIHNTFTKDENGKTILGEHTKTYNKKTQVDNGARLFPLTNEIEKILDEEINKQMDNIFGLIFYDYDTNTFITYQEINSWLARLNEKYKITKKSFSSHILRHTRITLWKEAGMDMSAIQYLAGHIEGSSITDNVYINVSQEFIFKEYQKIS